MKEHKHIGAYGILIENDEILLIKKKGGPYDGKLDLPGGTIEFCEKPSDALKRELLEEVGITINDYELFDADSIYLDWKHKDELERLHHIGIFFKIFSYSDEIKKEISIDDKNDDSMGAEFYEIKNLKEEQLSEITILELKKLGYLK